MDAGICNLAHHIPVLGPNSGLGLPHSHCLIDSRGRHPLRRPLHTSLLGLASRLHQRTMSNLLCRSASLVRVCFRLAYLPLLPQLFCYVLLKICLFVPCHLFCYAIRFFLLLIQRSFDHSPFPHFDNLVESLRQHFEQLFSNHIRLALMII